jgi:putative intracellular protease/amidase
MKILMILTSHDRLGESGDRTGFWLEEFAAPYYAFLDAGAAVTLASPRGRRWRIRVGSPRCRPTSSTRSSFPVATVPCGTSSTTASPSP